MGSPPPRPNRGTSAGVLRTRLRPPRLPQDALARDDLVDGVVNGLAGRLVVVSAGAGWGKTTLLAQALTRLRSPWVWCSCDERLASPALLVAHLAAGLGERFPGFGAGLRLDRRPERQVAELSNEIVATVPDDFVLVLDDVHELVDGPAGETLELLVRDLPPTVHLALSTRRALPFPLARLRPAGVLELGEEDLALSEEEAGALLSGSGLDLEPEGAWDLHRRTEGWPTGLLLAAQSGGALPQEGGDERLFDYLAHEVLARQSPVAQRFLLETAVLERFTPDLAAAVTGRADARELIEGLVARHVFVVRLDARREWYRLHQLFRAFLRRRLAREDQAGVRELHRRAAAAWRAAGEPEEAVRHSLAAGDLAAVVSALEPVAERMIETAEADTLAAWLDAIPVELWSDSPGLALAQASALFARSEYARAFDAIVHALDELLGAGEHERAAVAFFRLLRAMAAVGGQHERGIAVSRRYLTRIDPRAAAVPAARVILAGMYAQACRYAEAEEELSAACILGREAGSRVLEAWAAATRALHVQHPRGESEPALAALDESIVHLDGHEAEDDQNFLLFARGYRTVVLSDLGRHEEALAEAGRAREGAERRGLGRLAAPVLACLRLDALAGLERWEELESELLRTTATFARLGGAARGYLRHVAAARLAAHQGDAGGVDAAVAAAREGLRTHGCPFDESMALADLAIPAVEVGHVELARQLARDAGLAAELAGAPWAQGRAALVGALAWGPGGVGDRLLAEALEVSGRRDLVDLWAQRTRRLAAPLLARALEADLGPPGAAARLVAACGGEVFAQTAELLAGARPEVRARLAAVAPETPGLDESVLRRLLPDGGASRARSAGARPPLRLVTLGRLAVWRGGDPVPDSAFDRQKARMLLAALLCAQGPVHRDTLVGWLWPRLAPERGLAALHSTLYVLRRALEPGLARGASSSLVASEGPSYRLLLRPDDEWDAARFLALAAEATLDGDVERLLEAEAAHVGPFLPEWPGAEWGEPTRTEVEEAQRDVLQRLAERLAETGQPGAAIGRYRRLLALEPEREGWHRALMLVYAQAGERALALRQYHACRALLRQRLGIEPCRETRDLYSALLRDEAGSPRPAADPAGEAR